MAKNNDRVNTPTEQSKDNDALVAYRLTLVEAAVKEVDKKLDARRPIEKADMDELRDAVITRFVETRDNLQKQIDQKADNKDVDDIRTLIKAVSAIFGSIITSLIVYYLTTGAKK